MTVCDVTEKVFLVLTAILLASAFTYCAEDSRTLPIPETKPDTKPVIKPIIKRRLDRYPYGVIA